jgi:hypothetical protein
MLAHVHTHYHVWFLSLHTCPLPLLQLFTGSVSQLEQLLPQVAYGNIMAENPTALTPAHFRQLLLLGQACLDYLHAICCATSKVLVRCTCQLFGRQQNMHSIH